MLGRPRVAQILTIYFYEKNVSLFQHLCTLRKKKYTDYAKVSFKTLYIIHSQLNIFIFLAKTNRHYKICKFCFEQ